jgi:hypothetical protein
LMQALTIFLPYLTQMRKFGCSAASAIGLASLKSFSFLCLLSFTDGFT